MNQIKMPRLEVFYISGERTERYATKSELITNGEALINRSLSIL